MGQRSLDSTPASCQNLLPQSPLESGKVLIEILQRCVESVAKRVDSLRQQRQHIRVDPRIRLNEALRLYIYVYCCRF